MSKKLTSTFIIILLLLVAANSAGLWYVNHQLHREVVIDVLHVFNEFKMKKELEQRVTGKLEALSNAADSLAGIYETLKKSNISPAQLAMVGNRADSVREVGQQAYTKSNQAINEQVWQRLNTLIDEYGAEKGYRLMIGANGMGTVLYNEKDIDKTEDLIRYINARYEKGS